jgi:hypothetical protein
MPELLSQGESIDTSIGKIKTAELKIKNLTEKSYKSKRNTILFEAETIYILYSIL